MGPQHVVILHLTCSVQLCCSPPKIHAGHLTSLNCKCASNTYLSTESVDYVVDGIKSKNIATQTTLGGSTLVMFMCTDLLPKLHSNICLVYK